MVHCVAGISRSPTIIIAYMMKYCNKTLLEAYLFFNSFHFFFFLIPEDMMNLSQGEDIFLQIEDFGDN